MGKMKLAVNTYCLCKYSKKITDEKAARIGIKAFAFKPVVKAELAKTVRKVLDEAKDPSCPVK